MQNPIELYENALERIKQTDERDSLKFKHQAVLALSRAGSLQFALSEYERFGLNDIRNHEDIIALGGRLNKDLFLAHSGKEAQNYARASAEKYETAFKDTGGYYSGINAATMSLLGGVPREIVEMRAERILEILKNGDGESDEDYYFRSATRAEAYLLLGHVEQAQNEMRQALDYDPLNYTAHASTLKQFRMIAKSTDQDWPWLGEFDPPRAIHFAGHIFGREGKVEGVPVISKSQEKLLAADVSNLIQENDIGLAFGALAAGADIIIAETILEEGGELHVILPKSKDQFLEDSVKPYGKGWVKRFRKAIKAAHSVTITEDIDSWPESLLRQKSSLSAMGAAIRKSAEFAVEPAQVLIWDGRKGAFGTAKDASTWRQNDFEQFIIPYPYPRNARPHKKSGTDYGFKAMVCRSDKKDIEIVSGLYDAVIGALQARSNFPDLKQSIIYDLSHQNNFTIEVGIDLNNVLPGSIVISELAANYLSVYHGAEYKTDFVGLSETGARLFVLSELG